MTAARMAGTIGAQPWLGGRLLLRPPDSGRPRAMGGAPITSAWATRSLSRRPPARRRPAQLPTARPTRLAPARPPGLGGGAGQHDGGAGAGAAAGGALDAAAQTGTRDCGDNPGLPVGGAEATEGDLGQVDGASGSLSRHGSPGPVVPSHCVAKGTRRRSVVHGPAAPWTTSAAKGRFRGMSTPRWAAQVRMTDGSLFHRSAPRVSTGVRRLRRNTASAMETVWWADSPGTMMLATAMARFGSSWSRRRARPPRGSTGRRATRRRSGLSRFPVVQVAGRLRAASPTAGSSKDDELPSFSPVDGAPASPTEPEGVALETAAVHDAVDEGATAHGRDLHLLAGADGGKKGGGQVDGTQSSELPPTDSPRAQVQRE